MVKLTQCAAVRAHLELMSVAPQPPVLLELFLVTEAIQGYCPCCRIGDNHGQVYIITSVLTVTFWPATILALPSIPQLHLTPGLIPDTWLLVREVRIKREMTVCLEVMLESGVMNALNFLGRILKEMLTPMTSRLFKLIGGEA